MVILINPFYKERDEGEWNEPIPHIGQAYIASYYRAHGGEVELFDAHFYGWDNEILIRKMEPYMQECKLIGISVYTLMWECVKDLVKRLKELYPHIHITLGGYHPTLFTEQVLRDSDGVDSVIIGEGEISFAELAECIHMGMPWEDIEGIAYMKNGKVCINKERKFVENLDEFPFPARDYLFSSDQTVPLCASRGCFSNCSFCSISSFYRGAGRKKFRRRSVQNIVNEIDKIFHEYGNKEYWFIDDNFLSATRFEKDYALEFAKELERRNLNISFHLACRADEVNEEIVKALVKSGLKTVMVGVESANERQLKFYNKGYTPDICVEAINILKRCRVQRIHIGFIMFDPYVTLEELTENLNFLRKIKYSSICRFECPITLFNRLKGYPGTPIYDNLKDRGIVPDENNDYEFMNEKVKKLYDYILIWNENVYKIYKLMCAWIFKDFMAKGELVKAKRVYYLAYKYMELDETFFEKLLEFFKQEIVDEKKICNLLEFFKQEIETIYIELSQYKDYLLNSNKS